MQAAIQPNHGFDTQGFAFRFLANGLIAYTCPETIYYHRVNAGRSYYVREYESGKISYNWFKILEEFLFLFSEPVKHALLMFDVYANTSHQDSIMGLIRRYRTEEKIEKLYAPEYRQYIQPHIFAKVREYLLNKSNPDQYDLYWLGLMAQRDGDFLKSAPLL